LARAAQRGLVELQASDCGLCSQLSGAVQKGPVGLQAVNEARTSHEIICSSPFCFHFTPVLNISLNIYISVLVVEAAGCSFRKNKKY
jgi:hypothetical protein